MLDRPGIVLGIAALVLNEGATDENARAVIAAAVDAGVVALDTARAYARVDDDGVGERLAAEDRERRPGLPIITKAIRIYNSTPQTDQTDSGWSLVIGS